MRMTRRTFIGLAGMAALCASGLAGCSGGSGGAGVDAGSAQLTAEPESRDLWGSPDAVDVRVGLVMGPPSMGLSQFIVAAGKGQTYNNFTFNTDYAVDYIGLSSAFNQGDFDICTLPSNIGPILYNNHELKNEYRVVSVNNLGVLFGITTDPSVATLEDLAGRTVYAYGEGGTPEYTVEALLDKMGLTGSFNLEFRSSPFEVLNLLPL